MAIAENVYPPPKKNGKFMLQYPLGCAGSCSRVFTVFSYILSVLTGTEGS